MEHVHIGALDPSPHRDGRRDLSDPLGTTDVAVVHYAVAPGGVFSGALHAHAAQEEVFVVLEGTATFQRRDGTVEVGPGEAVRFAPGEFQRGYNAGGDSVRAVVLGAPRVTLDDSPITALVACEACGETTEHETVVGEDGLVRVCRDCGTANVPGAPPGLDDE